MHRKGEVSTDEKAAEISKEAWPTVKKYLPVIIPVLATTLYSGYHIYCYLLFNNTNTNDHYYNKY